MPLDPRDVAHAELEALRAELLARSQSEGTIITAALTIVAAIGGFALAKKDGRIEMLLVLPLVLSGLGIVLVQGVQGNRRIAQYIREHLWARLLPRDHSSTDTDANRSWEHFIHDYRRTNMGLKNYAISGVTPVVLIFVVPSAASLIVTALAADLGALWWLWGTGLVAIVLFGALATDLRRVDRRSKTTSADRAALPREKQ